MNQAKVMIIGATGLLGRALMHEFNQNAFKVLGTGYKRGSQDPNIIKLDIMDECAVKNIIKKYKPNFIIHAAAEKKSGNL